MDGWVSFALASAAFAGLTAILGKIGVEGMNSNFASFIRTVVVLLVTAALLSGRGEWQKLSSVSTRNLVFLVLSGLATGASWLCYYRALQLGPASRVAPVDKMSVAFAIVLSLLFLGESLSWKQAVGAGLVVCGSLLLAL